MLIVTHTALPHAVEKFAGVYSYAKRMGWRCNIVESANLGRGLATTIAPYHPDGIIHEGPVYEAGRLRAAFGASMKNGMGQVLRSVRRDGTNPGHTTFTLMPSGRRKPRRDSPQLFMPAFVAA